MSCNHCVSLINRAIKNLDTNATIEADIANHKVSISSTVAEQDILDALDEIGYPATTEASCCNASHSCHAK